MLVHQRGIRGGTLHIRKWHKGKIIILWAWGAAFAGLMLTNFLSARLTSSLALPSLEFLGAFSTLLGLSVLTWHWLGDRELKESLPPEIPEKEDDHSDSDSESFSDKP